MDVKRLTRGPAIWVIVFVVLLIIGARVFAPNQFKKVDTYQAINLIKSDSVVSAKIVDRDQRLELTLKDSAKIDATPRSRRTTWRRAGLTWSTC